MEKFLLKKNIADGVARPITQADRMVEMVSARLLISRHIIEHTTSTLLQKRRLVELIELPGFCSNAGITLYD